MLRLWVNGDLRADPYGPAISPLDHGITVGDGVFETIKIADGRAFAPTRHLERLRTSATGLGLPEPDLDLARRGIAEVLAAWPEPTGRLRLTYTGGPGPLGSERGDADPTLLIAAAELPQRPETTAVATVPWVRNERGALTGLKTTSYAENVRALAYAAERGGSEAIFGNTVGALCEGTGSNIFVVLAGRLVTPPTASGCLAGITRALVLEWCGGDESDLPLSVLTEAEEVFLTSTTRDVQAVHAVDRHMINAPGAQTSKVAARFAELAAAAPDP